MQPRQSTKQFNQKNNIGPLGAYSECGTPSVLAEAVDPVVTMYISGCTSGAAAAVGPAGCGASATVGGSCCGCRWSGAAAAGPVDMGDCAAETTAQLDDAESEIDMALLATVGRAREGCWGRNG